MIFFRTSLFTSLLLCICIFQQVKAMDFDEGVGRGNRNSVAEIFADNMIGRRRDKIAELLDSIERLERAAKMDREKAEEVGLDAGKRDEYLKRSAAFEQGLYNASKQLNEYLSPTWGGLIGKSLVEEELRQYIGVPNDWMSAIAQGTAINVTSQAGVVFRRRIRGILEEVLGGSLDFLTGHMQYLVAELYTLIFHGGYAPYTVEKLSDWQIMMRGVFADVEKVIEKGVAAGLRGHDMSARNSLPVVKDDELGDVDDAVAASLHAAKQQLDPYTILMQGYVAVVLQIVLELEESKRYYKKDSSAVVCANQIQNQLTSFAKILAGTDSITALNDVFKANKIMVVATKNLVDMWFESLKRQVAPRRYSFKDTASTLDPMRRTKQARSNYLLGGDDDTAYPSPF